MKKTAIYKYIMYASAVLLTACNDNLYDRRGLAGSADEVEFRLQVSEQASMTIGVGGTRSAASSTAGQESSAAQDSTGRPKAGDSAVRTLEGDNSYGLAVHRMTLPYVGIHHGAVKSAYAEDGTTRAHKDGMVSSAETFHDSLTVWGYTRNAQTKIFDRTLVQRVTNWRTSGNWPYGESGLMRFYAVAPSLENINMVAADADYDTPPVLTYTLPEKAQDMCDLLYGDSDPIDIEAFGTKESHISHDDKWVNLQFQHILTAVRFAQGKIPTGIRITRIAINRVSPRATFSPAVTDPVTGTLGAWSEPGGTQVNYTMLADFTGTGTENTYLNDSVFYMIPQTVPANVELEVELEAMPRYKYTGGSRTEVDGSVVARKHTLKCPLTGDVWKKGYTVTYLLTIGEVQDGYYFLVDPIAENEHSSTATSHNFTVHSYNSYWDYESWTSDGTEGAEVTSHGVNWKVVGYYSAYTNETTNTPCDKPSWLTSGLTLNTEYTGGYNGNASYNLSAQSPVKGGNHETILGANSTARSDDSYWNLSVKTPDGKDKSSETANCYIVNRIGNYQFPLVYGNKTTGTTGSPSSEADYFVDHTDEVIKYSHIEHQIKAKNPADGIYEIIVADSKRKRTEYTWNVTVGSQPVSLRAVLVWEDADGLLTGIQATTDAIKFQVARNTPGNAVIALQGRKVTKYEKNTGTAESPTWVLDTDAGTSGYDFGAWETLWTWHIWMTDEVYANEGTNNNFGSKDNDEMYLNWNSSNHLVSLNWGTTGSDGTNTILPVNLGWVPKEMDFKYYAKREVYVKLEQLSSGNTAVAHIVQHARQPLVRGVGTFYQWGRPTALPGHNWPDDATPKTVRTIYRNTTDFTDFTVENITHPYDVIAQPTKLFRRSDQMVTWRPLVKNSEDQDVEASYAYWGDGTTKTVYDPCPPGFQVPAISVFTGFSMTGVTAGSNTDNAKKLNMWDDAGENFFGGYFYVDPHVGKATGYHIPDADRYKQTVYMPATGQYQATKGVGSQLSSSVAPNNNYIETSPGTVWTYGQDGDHLHGQALNLYPDYDRVHGTKPAIELPRKVNISTACAIRPVQR